MVKENQIKYWFYSKNFMSMHLFSHTTVSDFIFRVSRDIEDEIRINEMYDQFITQYLEEAMEEGDLPTDLVLDMVGIDNFVEYVKNKFMILVKADEEYLKMNARELFIDMFSSPSMFFNAFRWGKK